MNRIGGQGTLSAVPLSVTRVRHIGEQKSGGTWHKVDEEVCTHAPSTP